MKSPFESAHKLYNEAVNAGVPFSLIPSSIQEQSNVVIDHSVSDEPFTASPIHDNQVSYLTSLSGSFCPQSVIINIRYSQRRK